MVERRTRKPHVKEVSGVPAAEIREKLMGKFEPNLSILKSSLAESRAEIGTRTRPLLTVVVSLREDTTNLTFKMFEHSLASLRDQARSANIDLDMIAIANSSGGTTPEMGEKMVNKLRNLLNNSVESENFHEIRTQAPPTRGTTATPWLSDIPLSEQRTEGENRYPRPFALAQ